jgi:5-(carboxyamino)imidazole ribonucleotide synthase
VLVAVLGAGQLGRMLALAGYPLGLHFRFLDPSTGAPAGQLAEQVVASYDDHAALARLSDADVVTYEFESIPEAAAYRLAQSVAVRPPPEALSVAQDRLAEKMCFQKLAIATAPFRAVDDRADLERAVAELGLPAVLKTRRLGYDGKGQYVMREASDLDAAWQAVGGASLIVERFVRFERELSIIGVRALDGTTAFYPVVENHHQRGLLRLTLAPAPAHSLELQTNAEELLVRLLDHFGYAGVLALELFEENGKLFANEMAPRVHNSGHWSIEGARTSQFENHLRAICGLPLGATEVFGPCAMLNLVGVLPDPARVLRVADAHLHCDGKSARPGRKMGHVTVRAPDEAILAERIEAIERALG